MSVSLVPACVPCAAVAYAVDAVTAADPRPRVVLAAAASASSTRVAPYALTEDAATNVPDH